MSDFEIWTDGGCVPNPGIGGYGIIIVNNSSHEKSEIKQGFKYSTNNRMELRAVIRALNEIPKEASVKLYTDSTYVVNHANGDETRSNNHDLWKLFDEVNSDDVEIVKVDAHKVAEKDELHINNNRCDRMVHEAREGELIVDEGYELTIKAYLNTIFKEFKDARDKGNVDMPELKKFMDKIKNNNPDKGSDEKISIYKEQEDKPEKTQMYLLKYAYAYFFEYLFMCNELIEDFLKDNNKDKKEISVVSLGCGTKIDYWAFSYILNMRKKDTADKNETDKEWPVVKYHGIDTIRWKYSLDAEVIGEDKGNFVFYEGSIEKYLKENNEFDTHDVYFFPKSISEIPNDVIEDILNNILHKKSEGKKDTIYFCITLRKTDVQDVVPDDAGKVKDVINKMKTGYQVKELKYIANTREDKIKDIAKHLLGVENNVTPIKLGSNKKKKIEKMDFAKEMQYPPYPQCIEKLQTTCKDSLKDSSNKKNKPCEGCKNFECALRENGMSNITNICDLIIKFERKTL